jgi:hypothetical protein
MSQASTNNINSSSKKAYHSPQLRKFGNVSELTLTVNNPFNPGDGGGASPNIYVS